MTINFNLKTIMAITKIKNHLCIVKGNYDIYTLLETRWALFEVTPTMIAADAKDNGISIDAPSLSRYKNQFDDRTRKIKPNVAGSLSQENILWLCERYGVQVKIDPVLIAPNQTPYAKDNKIKLKKG